LNKEVTLPAPVRCVVTGKDSSGKAVFVSDGPSRKVHENPETGTASTALWITDRTPASLSDAGDAGGRKIGIEPPPNGTVFRVVEFAPEKDVNSDYETRVRQTRAMGLGPEGPSRDKPRHPGMHRTATIDYAVILSGEIDLLLDDSEVHLKAGDTVVQRGTNHAWANRGDKPCQIVFILVDAKG
jgi:naringenin degradation protein FdeH